MHALVGLLILFTIAVVLILVIGTAVITWEALHPRRRALGWAIGRRLAEDPGELDLPFTEWTVHTRAGATLPVWDVHEREADPNAITVVLLHGWGMSRWDSLRRIAPFARTSSGAPRRVVMPDARAHGDADGPRSALGDGDVEDVRDLLERIDDPHVVLAGHSMGAAVSLLVAADEELAERIAGVIAIAPYRSLETPLGNTQAKHGHSIHPFLPLALGALRACGVRRRDAGDAASRIDRPILLLAGRNDPITPITEAEAIAEIATNATLVTFDCGHGDHRESDPERFDESIRAWLGVLDADHGRS